MFFLDVCIRAPSWLKLNDIPSCLWCRGMIPPTTCVNSGHTLRQVHCVGMWDMCSCNIARQPIYSWLPVEWFCGKWLFTRTPYTCTCVAGHQFTLCTQSTMITIVAYCSTNWLVSTACFLQAWSFNCHDSSTKHSTTDNFLPYVRISSTHHSHQYGYRLKSCFENTSLSSKQHDMTTLK